MGKNAKANKKKEEGAKRVAAEGETALPRPLD